MAGIECLVWQVLSCLRGGCGLYAVLLTATLTLASLVRAANVLSRRAHGDRK